jgi:hypothetical protein
MKKAKRVTKRQRKAMNKFLREVNNNQPQGELTFKAKPRKSKPMFSLAKYLQNQAQMKHDKQHHRDEKRAGKTHEGHDHK